MAPTDVYTPARRDNIMLSLESGTEVGPLNTNPNVFTAVVLTATSSSDGILDLQVRDTGGRDRYWVLNGVDVWRTVGGTDPNPSGQPLVAEGPTYEGGKNDPETTPSPRYSGERVGVRGEPTSLTAAQLAPVVVAAIERWAATGLSAEQVAALGAVPVRVTDLDDRGYLGLTTADRGRVAPRLGTVSRSDTATQVLIDDNGAGYGWFLDVTPGDDQEFQAGAGRAERVAPAGSPAAGQMDLLTVVLHELGQVLELGDLDPQIHAGQLMAGSLASGLRQVPFPAYALAAACRTPRHQAQRWLDVPCVLRTGCIGAALDAPNE